MLRRKIYQDLVLWKLQKDKTQLKEALLIKGARQVGKSYIVEKFGRNKDFYDSFIKINFIEHPELKGKIDVGFKVYREAKSNLEPYKPVKNDSKNSLNDLFQELEKQVTPLRKGWTKESLLTEIMLRQGFALDSIKESLKSLKKNDVICIKDDRFEGRLIICLDDKIHKDTILSLQLGDDDLFVCLDSAIDDENYCQLSDKGRIATI